MADSESGQAAQAVEMTDADWAGLDRTLDAILDAHRAGRCDAGEVRSAVAHIVGALALGNVHEFRLWLEPGLVGRYLAAVGHHHEPEARVRPALFLADRDTLQ